MMLPLLFGIQQGPESRYKTAHNTLKMRQYIARYGNYFLSTVDNKLLTYYVPFRAKKIL